LYGNCFLIYVVDGIIEGMRRRGRRHNLLLNELKEYKRYRMREKPTNSSIFYSIYEPLFRRFPRILNGGC
jgi:hypothetical protein